MLRPFLIRSQVALLAATASLAAPAQTAPSPNQSASQAAGASATPSAALAYQSALEGYKPFTEEKIVSWKEANETVGQIGGWRAYAKEARQTDGQGQGSAPHQEHGQSPAQSAGEQGASGAANPHAGHGKK